MMNFEYYYPIFYIPSNLAKKKKKKNESKIFYHSVMFSDFNLAFMECL